MTSNPLSSDFSYKKHSLQHLDEWIHDALNCEEITPEEIYNTILSVVDESIEYHKTQLTKSIDLLSLLKGNRSVDFDAVLREKSYYEGWDYTATGEKFPSATQRDWSDFWEETYYPEEHKQHTEEEMNAMCERAATENDKEKCREYNLREAEYYNKRAQLDAENEAIKAAGGYEWTPEQ